MQNLKGQNLKGRTLVHVSVSLAGLALIVALTALPAAAAAAITNVAPASGAAGTALVITGSGFSGSTGVTINGGSATFNVNSDTQIAATVPCTATTGAGTLTVVNPGGNGTTPFTVDLPGNATITSFSPPSGPVGTVVTIVGTNLCGATVKFNGTAATSVTVNSTGTQVTATVPTGATSGPINVATATTPGGVNSSTNFTVTAAAKTHPRKISFHLIGHLSAKGSVNATDGFSACENGQKVVIQKKKNGNWINVDTDKTDGAGNYKDPLKNKSGKYRAMVQKHKLASGDICGKAASAVRKYHV